PASARPGSLALGRRTPGGASGRWRSGCRTQSRAPPLKGQWLSRERSFPDLALERDLKAEIAVEPRRAGWVQTVDVERGRSGAALAKPDQVVGHQPAGQAPSPMLGHGAHRADDTHGLSPRVGRIRL